MKLAFAVVVGTFEDWAGPFCEEALGGAFDGDFGFLRLCVEEDHLSYPTRDEAFFVDGEAGEGGHEFALNVVGGEGCVGEEGFEEEADGFEEVVFRVDDCGFDFARVAVEEGRYFG